MLQDATLKPLHRRGFILDFNAQCCRAKRKGLGEALRKWTQANTILFRGDDGVRSRRAGGGQHTVEIARGVTMMVGESDAGLKPQPCGFEAGKELTWARDSAECSYEPLM